MSGGPRTTLPTEPPSIETYSRRVMSASIVISCIPRVTAKHFCSQWKLVCTVLFMRGTAKEFGAKPFIPAAGTLQQLHRAAQKCQGCELYLTATQAVLGEGPAAARVVMVGEQPGDREDLAGRPFVGPAGALLDRALADAGIERSDVYVTNAVKHFKFEERGKRRIHKKPSSGEIAACRPWLEAELVIVQPRLIVC